MTDYLLKPEWPAPPHIHAFTTKCGLGDLKETENRHQLTQLLKLKEEPIWIKQTHSNIAIPAISANRHHEADASFTNEKDRTCVVLTADCIPLLVCDPKGTEIAAIHAGWKGLANGVIANTFKKLNTYEKNWLVWLGPAISSKHYEVGEEVRTEFIEQHPENEKAFKPSSQGQWLMDVYDIAKRQLHTLGITSIYGGNFCTYSNPDFFSARRDKEKSGRMATLIWISK